MFKTSYLTGVQRWVRGVVRLIAECGSRLKKQLLTEDAIATAQQTLTQARELATEARESLASEVESISEFLDRVDIVPKLYLRYARIARHLLYYIIAGLGIEALISAILAKAWFPILSGPWAPLSAIAVAFVLSVSCHGFFTGMLSTAERLRTMRILRRLMIVFAATSLLLLVCPILSRVVEMPFTLTSICLGIIGITIPLAVGAGSAYRSVLLDCYARPLAQLRDYHWAAKYLETQIAQWERDLDKLRDLDARTETKDAEAA